ncbi:MAG: BBP7 family outer membrane beta-barrel protein [Pirellulaceae bacterium]|nr:BBP7 family outer membrane beta-barrel protein [Pirellulaceae bacterium]
MTETGPLQNWLFQIDDNFRARNDFHGSEIGLRNRIYRGRWSLEILTKIAIGNNHQVVFIDGQTIVTPVNQPTEVRDGGVFAVRSNEGTYTRDCFTMIPQLGVELGYQVNENWRAYIGYNLLYWGEVIHAAEQIDLNVDPRNIPVVQDPATPFPAFPGKTSSFWAQGFNLGLELRF